ncbi:BON domain-containing protein [Ochrobactrum sp. CGA5]|uniref:BON domain-containing protein n=1 Tax=Ochrobactrum sp. CGA5 TaxID=2583453 RepID=UPI00112488AD|nr:BON domain-containing protein [Ochrobactrum sp. CGA5]
MSDQSLRQDIIDELDFEPSIDSADIGVAVENGIATLTGHVPTFAQKVTVENVVLRVKGVRGIAEKVEVRPSGGNQSADDEIAKRAVNTINWSTSIPDLAVQVKVQNGWVTLTGKVDWQYQKNAATDAIVNLAGVIGVTNKIEIKARASGLDIKKRIEDALKRNAVIEAQRIRINVLDGGRIRLEGTVHAWSERSAVERAAWSAPGVVAVEDQLTIS